MRYFRQLSLLFVAISLSSMGCEKTAVLTSAPEFISDSILTTEVIEMPLDTQKIGVLARRCPGAARNCPGFIRITATRPLFVDDEGLRHIHSTFLMFLKDSIRSKRDMVFNLPGSCPELTRQDVQCVLGRPRQTAWDMSETGVEFDIDDYSFEWDMDELQLNPDWYKYKDPFWLTNLYFYKDTQKFYVFAYNGI